jgi:hypothetical protein
MNSLQNSISLRSNIFVSLSSRGNYQSPTKLQDHATMTTSEATPNQYTTLILMAVGRRKIGRKFLEHLRKKETQGSLIKDSISTAKEVAQQTMVEVATEPTHSQTSVLHVSW